MRPLYLIASRLIISISKVDVCMMTVSFADPLLFSVVCQPTVIVYIHLTGIPWEQLC